APSWVDNRLERDACSGIRYSKPGSQCTKENFRPDVCPDQDRSASEGNGKMKIVHIADLHLGYKQYQRQTANGLNQREADVAIAFKRAIAKIIEIKPDIVLFAGDVFHTVRPPNHAILHAFLEL